MYQNNLVSIIIPLYNAEKYIDETIKSVLSQTYKYFEVIVVDDCSKDKSAEFVKNIAKNDHRVKYYLQGKNMGAAEARNRGMCLATGRYIAFLDSDDLWVQDKIEKQLEWIKSDDFSFVYTAYDMINMNGIKIKDKIKIRQRVKYKDLLTETPISTPTIMFDREKIHDVKMPLRRTGQDYAFWLMLLKKTDAFGIDEVLVHVRRRPGSLSKNKFQNIADVWEVQTRQEKIPYIAAAWHLFRYSIYTVKKRFF